MNTSLRIAVTLGAVCVSSLFMVWALGFAKLGDVGEVAGRILLVLAIGEAACAVVFAVIGRRSSQTRTPPGDSNANGPRF